MDSAITVPLLTLAVLTGWLLLLYVDGRPKRPRK